MTPIRAIINDYDRKSLINSTRVRFDNVKEIDSQPFDLVPRQAVLFLSGQQYRIFCPGPEDIEFLAVCAPAWIPEDSFNEN